MPDIVVYFLFIFFFIIICVILYKIKLLEEEKYRNKEQTRQIKSLNETIIEQYEEIKQKDLILESKNADIYRKEKEIEFQKNNIQELWRSSLLQRNLNKQVVIYSEKKIAFLENKYTKIINSYKILFFRKMANLILEDIINKYKDDLSKTDEIFLNEEKPNEKQKKFSIIVVSKSVNKIKGIEKNIINLLFDFLNYIKDICSSIIHISKENYLYQIEILSEYIGREITKEEDDKYYINSSDLINILFDEGEISQNDLEKNSKLLKEFNNDEVNINKKVSKDIITISKDKHRKDKEIKVDIYNEEKKILQDNNDNNDNNNNNNKSKNEENNKINASLEKKEDKKLINEINKKELIIKNTENENKINANNKKNQSENEVIIINHHKKNKSDDREKLIELKQQNEKEIQISQEKEEEKHLGDKENFDKKRGKEIEDKMMENIIEKIINIDGKENEDNNKNENKDNLEKRGDENKIKDTEVKKENNIKKEYNNEKGDSNTNVNKIYEEKEEDKKNKKKRKKRNRKKNNNKKSGIDEDRKNKTLIKNIKTGENKEGDNINSKNPNNTKNMEKEIDIQNKFEEILKRLKKDNKKENDESPKNSKKNINSQYNYDFKELEKILFGDLQKIKFIEQSNWKVELIEDLKKYVNLITKINSKEGPEKIVVDNIYIFKEWKNSFGQGYKQREEFKNLVKLENDINLAEMKKDLLTLIDNHKYAIFENDPSNFQKIINNKISQEEIMNY